ncbi:MAG: alpha-L-glutamate ligase, partial [Myxococcota bacterium]|nr:alpha-L-glutamate ligase [Myxococcota bacterium]
TKALEEHNLPYSCLFTNGGAIDISSIPEWGVYINRMSPSSHTRGHQNGVQYMKEYLSVLESYNLPVINGSQSFSFELSKVRQHAALEAFGIRTPKTIAVVGTDGLIEAAKKISPPFITKHNQGGKGLGVQLFHSHEAFEKHIREFGFVSSPDNINLIQQYIKPAQPFITRVEIVNGVFQYAIQSSTKGGFELCPADVCTVEDAFCPAGESIDEEKFQLRTDITKDHPLVQEYINFCQEYRIDVAGIEFIEDQDGNLFTYDINCTTNYNSNVESKHGFSGMHSIAQLAKRKLGSAHGIHLKAL